MQATLKHFNFIDNPDFYSSNRRRKFMKDMGGFRDLLIMARSRDTDISSMCEMPVLKKSQEQYLFRQFNALKFSANVAIAQRQATRYRRRTTKIQEVKDVLFMSNVRLVVNFLKKKGLPPDVFVIKFSDSCEYMAHALDKFNYAFGNKFSTYCIWTLTRNFWGQYSKKGARTQERIRYIDPDTFLANYDLPAQTEEPGHEGVHSEFVNHLLYLANLSERELRAVVEITGLEGERRTAEEVGRDMGISEQRVSQIKISGIDKLRAALMRNPGLLEAI